MAVKLLDDVLYQLEIMWPDLLEMAVPPPHRWEYVWMSSALATISALMIGKRSSSLIVGLYAASHLFLGLVPVFWGFAANAGEFVTYCRYRQTKNLFRGFPVAVFWIAFLTFALQLHCRALYVAYQLWIAYRPKKKSV